MTETLDIVERYPEHYRQDELWLACSNALRGQSMGYVGIAGCGKSNMVRYLRDRIHLDGHLGVRSDQVHFAEVNSIDWDKTESNLWRMMLAALVTPFERLGLPIDWIGSLGDVSQDEGSLFSNLQSRVSVLCREKNHQLVFILDDFDDVIATGPMAMLEKLSKLRTEEGNVDRLSYLVFTKRLPHVIGRRHNLQTSQFFRLFRDQLFALGMYNDRDALQMLNYLNSKVITPIESTYLPQLMVLAGGHAGLIKVLFNAWLTEGEPQIPLVSHYAEHPNVNVECFRIMNGLHQEEQQAIVGLANDPYPSVAKSMIEHLVQRGILTSAKPVRWFSPLMPVVLQNRRS